LETFRTVCFQISSFRTAGNPRRCAISIRLRTTLREFQNEYLACRSTFVDDEFISRNDRPVVHCRRFRSMKVIRRAAIISNDRRPSRIRYVYNSLSIFRSGVYALRFTGNLPYDINVAGRSVKTII